MTVEEREALLPLLYWAEGFQKHARNLRTKPDTPCLDESIKRGREVLGVTDDDA